MSTPSLLRRAASAVLVLLLAPAARAQFCPLDAGEVVRKIVACRPGVTLEECRAMAQGVGCSVVRELASINALVIEVPAARLQAAEAKLRMSAQVDYSETDRTVNWLKAVSAVPLSPAAIDAPAGAEFDPTESAREILRRIGAIKPVTPENSADPELPWGVRRVNAAAAWGATQGEGVKVAVIDTGIDPSHPDLRPNLAGGFNALDPQKPGAWADDQGHGTHVAGTIAAVKDGRGVAGVAPRAKLYAIKVLDADGNGGYSDLIAGIEWAVKNGIKVANMSLGAEEGSEALERAVAAAEKAGLTIVAASGNSGGPVSYPAAYDATIAVGASDSRDAAAEFSSRGPEVDLIAPGVRVNSTRMGGGEEALSGTSMASPHAAGLAALAVARGASTPAQVRVALYRAAKPLPGLTPEIQGRGLVDASKLVAR